MSKIENIESKLLELKKVIPFKWRVQSGYPKAAPTKVIMIPYIDARDVADHLDEIIGASNWCDKFEEIKGSIYCSIGIRIDENWVFKSDCGTASQTEKEKGESSDAFKRAAVKWGINRAAYQVGTIMLPCKLHGSSGKEKPYPVDDKGNFLKGTKLNETCNAMAKISSLDNFDIEITDGYLNDDIQFMDMMHPNWVKVCEAVKNKTYTVEEIKEKYPMTEETEQKLRSL